MIGTFYRSSSPDKPAFVTIGDEVKKGQILARIDDRDSRLQREVLEARLKTIEEIVTRGELPASTQIDAPSTNALLTRT
jgi:multidrug resistance efflux pump